MFTWQRPGLLGPRLAAVALLLLDCRLEKAMATPDLPWVAPETVGFSGERLQRLDAMLQKELDEKEYAGIVTLVARHGKLVHLTALGKRDLASGAPMRPDTIFRIFSMSKPVAAAALMLLYEAGKWSPSDSIDKFIPAFGALKVYKGTDAAGKLQVEDPGHLPTLRELMTMTAGFTYGSDATPVDQLYWDTQHQHLFLSGSLEAMIARLAQIPLLYQPGSQWHYGVSVDIQGYLIEKLSGMSLPQFMQERLFGPLHMTDTGFYVPDTKRDRFATLYKTNAQGELIPTDYRSYGYQFEEAPALPIAGGGLVATARDYFRFAQMLLNGGELDGVRILSPASVKLILSNHLAESLLPANPSANLQPQPGIGFGFNGSVVIDPALAATPMGKGSYQWDGAAGTLFWIDPTNDLVFVGLVQRLGQWTHGSATAVRDNLDELCRAATYQALVHPDR